jgi:hypothetical protein
MKAATSMKPPWRDIVIPHLVLLLREIPAPIQWSVFLDMSVLLIFWVTVPVKNCAISQLRGNVKFYAMTHTAALIMVFAFPDLLPFLIRKNFWTIHIILLTFV